MKPHQDHEKFDAEMERAEQCASRFMLGLILAIFAAVGFIATLAYLIRK